MSESEIIKPSYTAEQVAEAARIIEETYDPDTGRHPVEIFYAICRTTLRPVVEAAIFDVTKEQILLTQRSEDDPFFAGMWHLPGVIVVPNDMKGRYPSVFDNAAVRLVHDELGDTRVTPLHSLSPKWVNQGAKTSRRGHGMASFYGGMLIDEEPAVGRMFDVGDLPEPLVEEHEPRVIAALQEAMCVAPGIDMRII